MVEKKKIITQKIYVRGDFIVKEYQLGGRVFFRKEKSVKKVRYAIGKMSVTFKSHPKIKPLSSAPVYKKIIDIFLQRRSSSKNIVLIFHNFSVTGAPLALFKIAMLLGEEGYGVLCVSPYAGHLEEQLREKRLDYLVIPHVQEMREKDYKFLFAGFDLAICNTYVGAYSAWKLQDILPTFLYIHEASDGIVNMTTQLENSVVGYPITELLPKVKHIACVSDFAASFYKPYSQNPIEIIPNFVEDVKLPYSRKDTDVIQIGYIGAIDPFIKKTDLLCASFEKLRMQYKNIELHLIGNLKTPYAQMLQKKYTEQVVWHGELTGTEKDSVLGDFDIVAVPSLSESCSLVALEAAAASKALIITENVGAKYVFEAGKSALICKADDEKSLCACLEQFINDRNLRDNLGRQARAAYEKFATKEHTKARLITVIHQVLAQDRKKA